MLIVKQKLKLMALYARPYLLVSLLIDAAVFLLLAGWGADDSMEMTDYVPMMTMLKIVSVAIVLFLLFCRSLDNLPCLCLKTRFLLTVSPSHSEILKSFAGLGFAPRRVK